MNIKLFKKMKEDLIFKYIKLLEESRRDEEINGLINGLISYHKDFNLDPRLIEKNGILQTIYYFYWSDKQTSIYHLEKASLEERKALEERIKADDMMLTELINLINDEKNMLVRQAKIKKIESKLSLAEISAIKEQYLPSSFDNQLKK